MTCGKLELLLAADTRRHTQTINIFCLGRAPRQKFDMPFRHQVNYDREAIDTNKIGEDPQ